MSKNEKDMKKRVELLKRTQEIDNMLNDGNIKNQALLDSTGESKFVDEAHALDILNSKQRSTEIPIMPRAGKKSSKSKKKIKRGKLKK